MCRSIKPLFNFDPPATSAEIEAASRQFVRKVCGFNRPSRRNAPVYDAAVSEIAGIVERLLMTLETNAPPKDREAEAVRARARMNQRFNRESVSTRGSDLEPNGNRD